MVPNLVPAPPSEHGQAYHQRDLSKAREPGDYPIYGFPVSGSQSGHLFLTCGSAILSVTTTTMTPIPQDESRRSDTGRTLQRPAQGQDLLKPAGDAYHI